MTAPHARQVQHDHDKHYFTQEPHSVPDDHVAAHNHVPYSGLLGLRGWHAWHQPPADNLVRCDCPALPHLDAHYITEKSRVRLLVGSYERYTTPGDPKTLVELRTGDVFEAEGPELDRLYELRAVEPAPRKPRRRPARHPTALGSSHGDPLQPG